jgi:hypothetical protein
VRKGPPTRSTAFATATAGPDGQFQIDVDPSSPVFAAALAEAAANNGWINFDLYAFGATGQLGYASFSRFTRKDVGGCSQRLRRHAQRSQRIL